MGRLAGLDDLALARQVEHGDEEAVEEFYNRFAPGLCAFIRRRIGNPADVEDVLSETMAAAVLSIVRFQGRSQVFTWLCRIAGFKIADFYRARRPEEPLVDENIPAAADVQELESNLLVWQVLYSLSPEHRLVLKEKYFTGLSVREIAVLLGKSEKAVEAVLVRARKAFARTYDRLARG